MSVDVTGYEQAAPRCYQHPGPGNTWLEVSHVYCISRPRSRLQRSSPRREQIAVAVVDKQPAGNMGVLTVKADDGQQFSITDLASIFGEVAIGARGTIRRVEYADGPAWVYCPDKIPGDCRNANDVQIRYTTQHGALVRSNGRTRPASLDEVEELFGDYVLNEMMENVGKWTELTVPRGITVTARVNGRDYELHVVSADAIASDYLVDTDERLIILPINAPLFSLVQAIGEASQHEPPPRPPEATLRRIDVRPVQPDPVPWGPRAAA